MTHSFFGSIPENLVPNIGVPGGPNWVDLLIGPGYDPAGGMWSSATDLSKYLHAVWLSPNPALITPTQRRLSLQPRLILPDGAQQVGAGWEIAVAKTAGAPSNQTKTYNVYGKSGDAGGFHAWLDVVPNLGYGVVVMSQESAPASANYSRVRPAAVRDAVHAILLPAFAEALAARLQERFAGRYADPRDGGAIAEEVVGAGNASVVAGAESFARLEVKGGGLFVRELRVNGTSAWEGLDALGWTKESQSRFFSTSEGVGLNPAEGVGENEAFGVGAQVWRVIPDGETCDWFDFDGYTDQNGWPLSKIVLVEGEQDVELHYPPYDIILKRQ
ncbi:Penicillin-binding protein [Neofusicoccum parvum]|nr:Penicillin-binding protein [Neofusicoccum parvum]